MTERKTNLAASVAARLLNHARQTGDVYQTLLTSFCFERFLYRLGRSEVRDRFVLEGRDAASPVVRYLASHFEFDRATLAEAVRRTFERRRTPIPAQAPIGLTPAYWENPSRPAQVRAFARRAGLSLPGDPDREFARLLGAFLLPILDDLHSGARCEGVWSPGGPWSAKR